MRLAHESSSQNYADRRRAAISTVLRSQALGDALLDHAKLVGNTAELQAKRELEEAHRILLGRLLGINKLMKILLPTCEVKIRLVKGGDLTPPELVDREMLELPPVTSTELEKAGDDRAARIHSYGQRCIGDMIFFWILCCKVMSALNNFSLYYTPRTSNNQAKATAPLRQHSNRTFMQFRSEPAEAFLDTTLWKRLDTLA